MFKSAAQAWCVEQARWQCLAAGTVARAASSQPAPPSQDVVKEVLWRSRGQQLDALALGGMEALGWPAEDVEPAQRRARARGVITAATRAKVARALTRAGVKHLFFKGALTDALWWGGAGLRGSLDVDVLVSAQDFAAAQAVLAAVGFAAQPDLTHPVTAQRSKEITLCSGDAAVDLHRAWFNAPFGDDTAGVLSRAQTYDTAVGEVVGPSMEDTLVLCAGNLAGDRFLPRVKLGLDAWQAVCAGADLGAAQERARVCGVHWSLWALLELLHTHALIPLTAQVSPPPAWVRPWLRKVACVRGESVRPSKAAWRLLGEAWPLSQRWDHPVFAVARWGGMRALDRWKVWSHEGAPVRR